MARGLKLVSKSDEVDPICMKVRSFVGKRSLPQDAHTLCMVQKRPLGAARKESLWCLVLQDCAVLSGAIWDPAFSGRHLLLLSIQFGHQIPAP